SAGDPEQVELMVKAARSIRVDEGPFSDDGPIQARKALRRLDSILEPDERAFLERCASVDPEPVPEWLGEGRVFRDALIDRVTEATTSAEPRLDDDTQRLLLEILDTVDRRLAATRTGDEAAVTAYLSDLETDPEGVRKALQHYTVVLAATLQQAAGREMRQVRGIDQGQSTFPSVIVDEAARANPLDLFIPLSMASRRVVLVGDHRQLPHLLEPDVERQLAEGVDHGSVEAQTLEAVRASLFERLWVVLRALEDQDGIRRTVTLDAQYRMTPVLGDFVSKNFYEVHGDGKIGSPRPEEQFAHTLPGYSTPERPCAAAWLDVPAGRGREIRGTSKRRPAEARVIATELRRLIDHDLSLTFGVISFYSAQVDEIGETLIDTGLTEVANNARGWRIAEQWSVTLNADRKPVERLRIGTVDAFQGKEFDVVFLSVTRSNDLRGETDEEQRRKYGHLMLENRLCVAMSRQQRLLISVGDLAFVRSAEPLPALRAYIDVCGGAHGVIR
ncbi:MAG: AAA family ATPase, partial [Gemmatimonadales bacterium]|nr:AAA family ATPase [Gemmatimonadales bacterium]